MEKLNRILVIILVLILSVVLAFKEVNLITLIILLILVLTKSDLSILRVRIVLLLFSTPSFSLLLNVFIIVCLCSLFILDRKDLKLEFCLFFTIFLTTLVYSNLEYSFILILLYIYLVILELNLTDTKKSEFQISTKLYVFFIFLITGLFYLRVVLDRDPQSITFQFNIITYIFGLYAIMCFIYGFYVWVRRPTILEKESFIILNIKNKFNQLLENIRNKFNQLLENFCALWLPKFGYLFQQTTEYILVNPNIFIFFYIVILILPRLLVSLCFFYDIFITAYFYYFYKTLILLILPVFGYLFMSCLKLQTKINYEDSKDNLFVKTKNDEISYWICKLEPEFSLPLYIYYYNLSCEIFIIFRNVEEKLVWIKQITNLLFIISWVFLLFKMSQNFMPEILEKSLPFFIFSINAVHARHYCQFISFRYPKSILSSIKQSSNDILYKPISEFNEGDTWALKLKLVDQIYAITKGHPLFLVYNKHTKVIMIYAHGGTKDGIKNNLNSVFLKDSLGNEQYLFSHKLKFIFDEEFLEIFKDRSDFPCLSIDEFQSEIKNFENPKYAYDFRDLKNMQTFLLYSKGSQKPQEAIIMAIKLSKNLQVNQDTCYDLITGKKHLNDVIQDIIDYNNPKNLWPRKVIEKDIKKYLDTEVD